MKPKLSIIIPCYNCKKTVEEAVESCYTKPLINFEIIMVNDGSTDNTEAILQKLSEKYKQIKIFHHEKNRGGGAARNTGIKNSNGEFVFCLDSDNILDPESLEKILDYIVKNKVDGAAFYERRFFHSKNKKFYTSNFYHVKKETFTIENLFDNSHLLLDNFVFTKESYMRTGGYPEHHGFDTQSYEVRFLSSGNTVLICPNTFIYHRQNSAQPSYFEREFNKGNFSLNSYFVIEDIWNILSSYAKIVIINYDIFKKSTFDENIIIELNNLYKKNKLFKTQTSNEESGCIPYKLYDDFIINYQNKKYSEALDICKKLLKNNIKSKLIFFNMIRSSVGLSGEDTNQIETQTSKVIEGLRTEPKTLNKWYHKNMFTHIIIKFINIIRKKTNEN